MIFLCLKVKFVETNALGIPPQQLVNVETMNSLLKVMDFTVASLRMSLAFNRVMMLNVPKGLNFALISSAKTNPNVQRVLKTMELLSIVIVVRVTSNIVQVPNMTHQNFVQVMWKLLKNIAMKGRLVL